MLRRTLVLLAVAVVVLLSVPVAPALARFGFRDVETTFTNQDGSPDVQAGSHPWEMTTSLSFNEAVNQRGESVPDEPLKDLDIELPAGVTGDPSTTPKCTAKQFHTTNPRLPQSGASCPDGSQIGVANITEGGLSHFHLGVYNLVPPAGSSAEFGFNIEGTAVLFTPKVRTGGDYGLTIESNNAGEGLSIHAISVNLWGVPADTSHDPLRGECLDVETGESVCSRASDDTPKPFLSLPTECPAGPLTTTLRADSWQAPGSYVEATTTNHDKEGRPVGVVGCDRLDFNPTVSTTPETNAASSPTGLGIDIRVPQNGNTEGLAEADLRTASLMLPTGIAVNPSIGDGLSVCTPPEIALEKADLPSCPEQSKVGTVQMVTPLLETPLEGSIYAAEQGNNPFGSVLAIYVTAEADGVLIKLAGNIETDPLTGQVTTVFENMPLQPISELKLTFFGGPRAVLVSAPGCGIYTAVSSLSPWSAGAAAVSASQFGFLAGCGGGFAPTFTAGAVDNRAAGFSNISMTFARSDQDQLLRTIAMKLPPGLLGYISHVQRCAEPQAQQGACPAASLVGHTTILTGAGTDPVTINGQVFLTGPYHGAPFGLSIVAPAIVGPFDLGLIVVRATVGIDLHTAQIEFASDPLPTILKGIPLKIKLVNLTVDRSDFMFNATSCEPLSVAATIASTQGASAQLSNPYRVTDCAPLQFKPKLTASAPARTSRAGGAALDVKIALPKGPQTNIRKVVVELPKQLSARLTTIQKACREAVFDASPKSCPAGAEVGTAKVVTPVLDTPLSGPVYLVSHGGSAFPGLVIVLTGGGVSLDVVGTIEITRRHIASVEFGAVPDAPISGFELKLPEGPHSALAANLPTAAKGRLCGTKLVIPTTLTAHDGAQLKQQVGVAISGCPKRHRAKAKRAPERR